METDPGYLVASWPSLSPNLARWPVKSAGRDLGVHDRINLALTMLRIFVSRKCRALAIAAAAGLAAFGLHAADTDFRAAVLATRPVAYYRLAANQGHSELGPTTFKSMGGVTSSSPGAVGLNSSYVDLNGRDGYILTTQSGGVGATASIMVWAKLATLPSNAGRFLYLAGESQNGNDLDLQFELDNALKFYTAAGGHLTYTPAPVTLLNQWHMIVATMDNASQTRVIYWDGKPVANDKGGGKTGKTGVFSIGASTVFGGRWFQGGMQEAALWDRALTAVEVGSIYAAAKPAAAGAGPSTAAGGGAFPTTAKVEVGENTGNMIPLKSEEKIAILFLTAIDQIETECMSGSAKRACSMSQIMTSDASHADHLKFDPKTDSNYSYTLAVNGTAWEAHATPKKPGLSGFYFMQRSWPGSTLATYNRSGAAGVIDTEIGRRSIEGDSFATQ